MLASAQEKITIDPELEKDSVEISTGTGYGDDDEEDF